MTDRRAFIATLAVSLGAAVLDAGAQATKIRHVGFLSNGGRKASPQDEAFRRSLRELGWVEGQNVAFEYRWAEGNPDLLPGLIAELVQSKLDVIVVAGTLAVRAAQKATTTTPVVFVLLTDP